MKKIIALFLSIVTAVSMTVSSGAIDIDLDEFYGLNDTENSLTPTDLLTDNADILSSSEEERIGEKLEDISEKYGIDVLVYTTRDVPYDSESACMDFAFDRIEEYLYAEGKSDGIIFVVDMNYRLWNMSTKGKAEEAITESYGLEILDKKCIDSLSDGDYEECFMKYAETCEKFLKAYDEGKPYGPTRPFVTAGMIIKALLIGAVIGLVVALIVTSGLKKQLKSVDKQKTANNFVRRGSFDLKLSQDLFLYKNVTKTRRQSSSSGGGRSGGGGSRGGSRGGRF
ncbi:MAG: TPM domain-containing protein [Oscillospiraceae bacterium]|nr:TPM domain-containing protein [Oscillospiraceae bacterium]